MAFNYFQEFEFSSAIPFLLKFLPEFPSPWSDNIFLQKDVL